MRIEAVVVVGAGPAGLAASALLTRSGTPTVCIDRADRVGSAWYTRYDNFRLHTIRWLSDLPGLRMPRRFGPWVARDDFIGYLQDYADHFGIAPRLGVEAGSLERVGSRWRLITSDGPIEAEHVILATGATNAPHVPDWPGRPGFRAPVIHSSEYRNPGRYSGQKVLVVGSGNSATEIAVDLALAGVDVDMAVRTPPGVVRRDTAGVPTQLVGIAFRRAPAAVMNPVGRFLRRTTIPDLAPFGLPAPSAPFTLFSDGLTVPVVDHGFVGAVRAGRIRILAGVGSLNVRDVVHVDGTRSRPDAVIAATGYRAGLGRLLGPLDLLDSHGLPTFGPTGPGRVWRGLHTVGIGVNLSGQLREIGLDARRLARAVA